MVCRASIVLLGLVAACGGSSDGSGGEGASALCEATVCSCTEAGIRAAIESGGGRYTFDCDGPTTVVTEAELVVLFVHDALPEPGVVLDGEGQLTIDANGTHRVLSTSASATAELRGVTLTGGVADQGDLRANNAGGIWNRGELTLVNSAVSENTGRGITNHGAMTLINSTVSGNAAGGVVNSTGGGGRDAGGALTLIDSVVSGNSGAIEGGGLHNSRYAELILVDSVVSGNASRYGGGISNAGFLTLIDSAVLDNAASADGGGIATGHPTHATGDETAIMLVDSTVSENSASGDGGGIWIRGRILTVLNSTVSANSAGFMGGGIYILLGDTDTALTNAVLTGNTAEAGSGLVVENDTFHSGTVTMNESVLAGDCAGEAISSRGYNIESPGDTCGFDGEGDRVNVDPDDLDLHAP